MNTQQKICNFCGKTLVNDTCKEDYLSVKGSVCVHSWLPKQDRYSHIYLTQINSRYMQDILKVLNLTDKDFTPTQYQRTLSEILSHVDYPLFDFCDMKCFEGWSKDKKHNAVDALYKAYCNKVTETGDDTIELEAFGITEDDLKEFDIGQD